MLSINEKKFMNLPEAVQWLLNNNALPFQCKSNYVADTIIAFSEIINPSPAEVKVGSLVLFADGKVGTVSGITANGFMVGSESTDLADGVPHITDISVDASSHLIITMSEGDPIDAGLIRGVSSMSIDASQHLIVNYNDGTTQDLGAIFQGNINIAGNLTANSIIENMNGYAFDVGTASQITYDLQYAGVVKNGNKITFAIAGKITRTATAYTITLGSFTIPSAIGNALFPTDGSTLEYKMTYCAVDQSTGTSIPLNIVKTSNTYLTFKLDNVNNLTQNQAYFLRAEVTFLLSANLVQ